MALAHDPRKNLTFLPLALCFLPDQKFKYIITIVLREPVVPSAHARSFIRF